MKSIQTTFTSCGFALFRRFKQGGGQEHFEVVRIRHHNGFKIPRTDKVAPPAETYPSPEKWGVDGFTYPDCNSADVKFRELFEKQVART